VADGRAIHLRLFQGKSGTNPGKMRMWAKKPTEARCVFTRHDAEVRKLTACSHRHAG
jgi:hypothetical protein